MRNLLNPINLNPGISEMVYIALVSWFVSGGIKKPTAPFVDPGDEVLIKESHEFTSTYGFLQFALAAGKNSLDAKGVGDLMMTSFDFEVKIFMPGSYIEVHSTIRQLLNKPLIALVKDSNCGSGLVYQIGNACTPAYIRAAFATGTTKDGNKGYDAVISCNGNAVIIYGGAITPYGAVTSGSRLIDSDGGYLVDADGGFLIDNG